MNGDKQITRRCLSFGGKFERKKYNQRIPSASGAPWGDEELLVAGIGGVVGRRPQPLGGAGGPRGQSSKGVSVYSLFRTNSGGKAFELFGVDQKYYIFLTIPSRP